MQAENAAACPYGRRLRQLHLAIGSLITLLAVTGLIFYFRKSLGLADAKLLLMTVHSLIGYALVAAAAWRIWLGIKGPAEYRFSRIVAGPENLKRMFAKGDGRARGLRFAGRSPLSRVLATVLYAAMLFNIGTGLIRAGTDLYFPPFGPLVLHYVTPAGEKPSIAAVKEGNVDKERADQVRKFKAPVGKIHFYVGLFIAAMAAVHAGGALATEWSAPNDKSVRGRARLMLFGPGKIR